MLQLIVERTELGHEAALQARAHALVEAVDLGRVAGGGHDDLAAAIEQGVDDVIELLLGFLPA